MTRKDTDPAVLFDVVLFDLDGTIADLVVDWGAVRDDVARSLAIETGMELDGGLGKMITEAMAVLGSRGKDIIARILAGHESRAKVRPIPAGLALLRRALETVPVGIVSNNMHRTVLRALNTCRVDDDHIIIVGFDDVERIKPDPQGINMALSRIGRTPDRAVYVGNSDVDRQAAQAADISFRHIEHEHV